MKRIKIKYEKIYSVNHIIRSIRRYNKNRPKNKRISDNLIYDSKLVSALRYKLKTLDKIDFSKYREKILQVSSTNKKERHLLIPSKTNLLIQACLLELVESEMDKKIPLNSYSSRKNRGTHALMLNLRKFIRKVPSYKKLYCLYFDIHKYYDNIDHDILFDKIKNTFKDKNIIELFGKIIYSVPNSKGIPIGNACSHLLANLYQAEILDYVNKSSRAQFAAVYMDNWVILSTNKKKLASLRKTLFKKLKTLKLEVNPDYTIYQVNNNRGVKIAGFVVFKNTKTYCYPSTWKKIKRIISLIKNTPYKINSHIARSFMSRYGTFKYIRQFKKINDLIKSNLDLIKTLCKK